MRDRDDSRKDDFISISGSKMRKLAALAAKPCPPQIPSDLIAAKCIPPGFMVQKGWEVVSDYYIRQKTGDWVPYSKQLGGLPLAPSVRSTAEQPFGKINFAVTFMGPDGVSPISPWHDLPLYPSRSAKVVNFVCEIPRGVAAKLEVNKKLPHNPIMQDTKKGKLRYYTYGASFFNYGMLPQTWEDPAKTGFNGTKGDNDPLDVMEIGTAHKWKTGEMRKVKVLGDLELIDQGELDHKIIVIDEVLEDARHDGDEVRGGGELVRHGVLNVDDDDLVVELALVDELEVAEDLDLAHLPRLPLVRRANLHDVEGVVVALGAVEAGLGGVLPGLRQHAVVEEGGAVRVVAQLALLRVLHDRVVRQLLVDLELGGDPARDLADEVDHLLVRRGRVEGEVVPGGDGGDAVGAREGDREVELAEGLLGGGADGGGEG